MGDISDSIVDAIVNPNIKLGRDKYFEIQFLEILKETDKAWLIKVNLMEGLWLPKSRCTIQRKLSEPDLVTYYARIPSWLSVKLRPIPLDEIKTDPGME